MTDIASLSLTELRNAVAGRDVSARQLVSEYLTRIGDIDPTIHALLTRLDESAITAAEKIDARIAAGDDPGPLAGIPVLIKDNMQLNGTRTTAGSKILENYQSQFTATAVRRLIDAGAIVIGKTNLDEFAMGSSCENSAFFPTRNPFDPDRIPGGSSGGSAAAVSARLAPVALGSDTGGSIRQPASLCGVVGVKPTYGRVSRYGLLAYGSSLDQIGTFATTVADAALVTRVIAGHDPFDSTTSTRDVPDYPALLKNTDSINGLRIGRPVDFFSEGLDAGVREKIDAALDVLKGLGATIVDVTLPHSDYAVAVYYIIATSEASSNLARYDGVHYGHRTADPTDLIGIYSRSRAEAFGMEVKRRIMLGTYALSSGYYDAYYLKAQKVRRLIKADFDTAFESCDIIAGPTSPTTAFRIGEKTDDPLKMYLSDIYTISVNLAGLPGMSIPCGFDPDGLPVGLQLIGRPFDEETLFRVGDRFQQETDYHKRIPVE